MQNVNRRSAVALGLAAASAAMAKPPLRKPQTTRIDAAAGVVAREIGRDIIIFPGLTPSRLRDVII